MISGSKKNIFKTFVILLLVFVPVLSFAAPLIPSPVVPNCPEPEGCGFVQFIELINNVVSLLIALSFPIAAGVIAWAGFNMIMDGGNGAKRKESIEMIKKVVIGFVIILSAWIVVSTLLNALLSSSFKDAVQIVK